MEEIDLLEELNKGISYFENKIIRCYSGIRYNRNLLNISEFNFTNCVFLDRTTFGNFDKSSDLSFYFNQCTFQNSLIFNNCKINLLEFQRIRAITEINISGSKSELQYFEFIDSYLEKGDIKIQPIKINEIEFRNLYVEGTIMIYTRNQNHPIRFFSENLCLDKLFIGNSYISEYSDFSKIKIKDRIVIKSSKFDRVYFDEADLGKEIVFNDCKFNSYIGFYNCRSLDKTHFKIQSCLFKSFPHFNNSEFDYLDITHTTFDKKVSFDSVKVNAVNFYQVSFLGGAFFDDFKITNPFDNNKTSITEKKRTYRTIKQELQKLENRIDYNIFRMYELTIHLQEVNQSLKNKDYIEIEKSNLLKDKCILWLHQYVSNFGTDWRKALAFIFCSGFTFYTILYMIEHLNQDVDLSRISHFLTGFFNYILITNFDNPLTGNGLKFEYVGSLIVFIFGKILIAFGIYEMIQSFRKFRY